MQIRLARIDDRLIHGQVATVWSKEAGGGKNHHRQQGSC